MSAFAQCDALVGFYKGSITLEDGSELKKGYPLSMYPQIYAEVYRGPQQKYRVKILTGILARAEANAVADNLSLSNGKIEFETSDPLAVKGEVSQDGIAASGKYQGQNVKLSLKRFRVQPPTLGEKPPAGAVVLFDGTKQSMLDNWELAADKNIPANWIVGDGAMTVKTDATRPNGKRLNSTIESKKAFGKCRLHIEFKIPPMYEELGQRRANSGVFFGPYEIQVLDSFGADASWDHCGSLYRQTPSQYNASLEPGAWQAYDIFYFPPKYEGGKCVEPAKFTVFHNGKRVQYETPVPYSTSMPLKQAHTFVAPKGPVQLKLQDHTNPVSFRNIWVEKL